MGAARFVVAFLALAGLALVVISLAFVKDNWYETRVVYANNVTQKITYGPLQTCANGDCAYIKSQDSSLGSCTRKGKLISARIYSCLGCAILGGLLFLIAIPVSFPNVKGAAIARVVLLAFAFAALAVCATLFYVTIEQWLFCDKTFCEMTGSTAASCSEKFTVFFYLLCAAGIDAFLATLVGIAAVLDTPPTIQATPGTTAPALGADELANIAGGAAVEPKPAGDGEAAAESGQQENADAADEAAAEDDWVWDEESAMYWSDSAYLYLHAESGMFYDPQSGWWFDPEGGWFDPEAPADDTEVILDDATKKTA
jgi:hypothetical protein